MTLAELRLLFGGQRVGPVGTRVELEQTLQSFFFLPFQPFSHRSTTHSQQFSDLRPALRLAALQEIQRLQSLLLTASRFVSKTLLESFDTFYNLR
jgi:hypothetical protein